MPIVTTAQSLNVTISGGGSSLFDRREVDCCAIRKTERRDKHLVMQAMEVPGVTVSLAGKRFSIGYGFRYFFQTQNPALLGNKNIIKYLAYGYGGNSNVEVAYNRKYWSILGTAGATSPGLSGYLNHLHVYAGLGAELNIPLVKEEGGNLSLVIRGEQRALNTLKLLGHLNDRSGWDFKGMQRVLTVGIRFNISPDGVLQRRLRDDRTKIERRQQQKREEDSI
ncbi:MAG TPA: hypothetical protein PLL64_01860 [Rhodothermales bacterium]|nr:hypothetical protein [Rhodothermales bacterium]HRR08972.1 hypothetical protein [Rhodothermales bacterium]